MSFKTLAVTLTAALTLSACAETMTPEPEMAEAEMTRLSTTADMAAITDRTLVIGENEVVIKSDGTLTGTFGGGISGTWRMEDGFWCRTLIVNPTPAPAEDCQLLETDGKTVNGTRDRGNGASFTYDIAT